MAATIDKSGSVAGPHDADYIDDSRSSCRIGAVVYPIPLEYILPSHRSTEFHEDCVSPFMPTDFERAESGGSRKVWLLVIMALVLEIAGSSDFLTLRDLIYS